MKSSVRFMNCVEQLKSQFGLWRDENPCESWLNVFSISRGLYPLLMVLGLTILTGCRQDMHDQPKYKALAPSSFFSDGRSARPLVPGTVARGELREDTDLYQGKVNGKLVDAFPFPVTKQILERGQERYNIYCVPCHGLVGDGQGMVVRRGFRAPPSYHSERLRQAPAGYFYDVITNGFGAMQDYSVQVPVRDRWAIVAYIRALQLSQHASLNDVAEADRNKLNAETGSRSVPPHHQENHGSVSE
jgi:mono/diheme cytochrome c family protein